MWHLWITCHDLNHYWCLACVSMFCVVHRGLAIMKIFVCSLTCGEGLFSDLLCFKLQSANFLVAMFGVSVFGQKESGNHRIDESLHFFLFVFVMEPKGQRYMSLSCITPWIHWGIDKRCYNIFIEMHVYIQDLWLCIPIEKSASFVVLLVGLQSFLFLKIIKSTFFWSCLVQLLEI